MTIQLPLLHRPGQKDGQVERAQRYAEKYNANLVSLSPTGKIVTQELTEEAADMDVRARANDELMLIRSALSSGSDRVMTSCGDRRVVDEVVSKLTPEERAKVHFSFFDVPIPQRTVQL